MRPLEVLLGMIVFDFWLHLGELFAQELWPVFPTRLHYTVWWTAYWGVAIVLIMAELKLMSKRNEYRNIRKAKTW